MDDDEPRRLPPRPSAMPMCIPEPAVPEVTLLWDSEDSVYWRQGGAPATAGQAGGHTAAMIPNRGPELGAQSLVLAARVTTALAQQVVPTPPAASHVSTSTTPAQLLYSTGHSDNSIATPLLHSTALGSTTASQHLYSLVPGQQHMPGVGQSSARVINYAARSNMPTPIQNISPPPVMQASASVAQTDVLLDNGARISPPLAPNTNRNVALQNINNGSSRQNCDRSYQQQNNSASRNISNYKEIHKILCQPISSMNGVQQSHNQLTNQQYNPLVYSSEKKRENVESKLTAPLRTTTNNANTPRQPKTIIPRSVDFEEETPIDVRPHTEPYRNKENVSPDLLASRLSSQNTKTHSLSNAQIIPYNTNYVDSPQNNSPDPFLCKIIDGKDQQIFQLHKVLEKVLENVGTPDRNSCSHSSPQLPSNASQQQLVVAQCPESRTIGVNTDISWHSLVESLKRDLISSEQCNRERDTRHCTILKNSVQHRSSVSMQRSCNTSSVRFLPHNDIIETNHGCSTETKGAKETHAKRMSNGGTSINGQNARGTSNDCRSSSCKCSAPTEQREEEDQVSASTTSAERRSPCRAGSSRAVPRGTGDSVVEHSGMNHHREVSLTLREVVLTTIQEDVGSPEQSLHLDLPDYQPAEDTLYHHHGLPTSPLGSYPRHQDLGRGGDGRGQHRDGRDTPHQVAPPQDCILGGIEDELPESRGQHVPWGGGTRNTPRPGLYRTRAPQLPNGGSLPASEEAEGSTGVTVYRNLVRNLQQVLETVPPQPSGGTVPPPAPAPHHPLAQQPLNGPLAMSNTLQYARQRGVAPRLPPYHPAQHQQLNTDQIRLQQQLQHFGLSFLEPRNVGYSVGAARDTNAAAARQANSLDNEATASTEFSVATVEFLRNNGLLNTS